MQMSINRALAELKLLDKKIEKAIEKNQYVATAIGKKSVKGFDSVEAFNEDAKAKFQSLTDLIKRRQAIKSAIVKSNAETIVQIGNKSMTVAEVIERKTSIKYEQNILKKLNVEYNNAHDYVEIENGRVQGKLDLLLQSSFAKDTKTTESDIEVISKPYLEANGLKVIDPLNARAVSEKLEKEIVEFLTEVDYVLTDSNSLTKFEIED